MDTFWKWKYVSIQFDIGNGKTCWRHWRYKTNREQQWFGKASGWYDVPVGDYSMTIMMHSQYIGHWIGKEMFDKEA